MTERKSSGWFYTFEKKEYISVIIFAVIAIAIAAWNIYTVVDLNNSVASERSLYEMAKGMLDSGFYDAAVSGYDTGYSSAYMQSAIAELDAYFGFVDAVSISYTISCSLLIAAAVAMIARLRFSFKFMMGAYIIMIAVVLIFDIWGMVSYDIEFAPASLGIRVMVAGALMKTLWRYNMMAYEDVKNDSGWVNVSPAAAGVPMPAVKELNSGLDSFVPQAPVDKPMESVGTGMAEIVPVGTAVPTERDKLFQPTEVAPAAQPVMPLQDASARRADVGVMTGEVVTPLDRPMIPVEMMEDEAMPDLSPSQAQPVQDAAPVQSAHEINKGVWFCSKCGSLNENANFCVSCGSPKE